MAKVIIDLDLDSDISEDFMLSILQDTFTGQTLDTIKTAARCAVENNEDVRVGVTMEGLTV